MMFVPLLLLVAQTAVPAPVPTTPIATDKAVNAPVPRQPLISLFFYEDYPAALQGREGRRGVVNLKLTADPSGRLVACRPSQSSGDKVLEMASCNILRRRARFTPATDAGGAPTNGTLDLSVDWDAIFHKFGKR
jgi:protein TonB